MKRLAGVLLAVLGIVAISSCGSSTSLYNWRGYDSAVYNYIKKSDESSKQKLIERYEAMINGSKGTRGIPPPGICADYGYILIMDGKIKEGKEMLVMETQYYPESKPFIDRILKRFEQ